MWQVICLILYVGVFSKILISSLSVVNHCALLGIILALSCVSIVEWSVLRMRCMHARMSYVERVIGGGMVL